MALADVWAETIAQQMAIVEAQTFGHLAPELQRCYSGWILFAWSVYSGDGVIVVDEHFEGLMNSPWFYQDVNDFLDSRCPQYPRKPTKLKQGGVYRFEGTYTKFKTGGYRFSGKITTVIKALENRA